MSREKQIEEMARCICERDDGDICTLDRKQCDCKCTSGSIAELLYERGYRKSEWISVDERLPDNRKFVIACDKYGNVGEAYYRGGRFEWIDDEEWVEATHWMPLPEAPKMKGGAE